MVWSSDVCASDVTAVGNDTGQNLVGLDRWPGNEGKRYGQVKLTIAQFFLPDGSSTQNKGVVPDLAFPVMVDASEFGESTYDNALPWTRIAAVPHTQYGTFAPPLPNPEATPPPPPPPPHAPPTL